jgi:hypothetical protein
VLINLIEFILLIFTQLEVTAPTSRHIFKYAELFFIANPKIFSLLYSLANKKYWLKQLS